MLAALVATPSAGPTVAVAEKADQAARSAAAPAAGRSPTSHARQITQHSGALHQHDPFVAGPGHTREKRPDS